ncbi:MAG TPA: polyprenyl synthetase family protein [Clostridia bacterium]|nr:polyprenyl synthetase family protein [Clostridia bacterium]
MVDTLYQDISINEDLLQVQSIIRAQLYSSTPFIQEALTELIENNGKMLRPALLILAARFGSAEIGSKDLRPEDKSSTYRLAAAVELLHMATLVHDDIIDKAATRRGIPTLHTRFDPRTAVLLGDFLFTRSFQIASQDTDIETGRYIAGIVNSICESEIRQHNTFSFYTTSFKEYHRRIMGKTAALFALSAYVGAHENGVDERNSNRLKKIGYNLGAGFQIIDDILDFTDQSDRTGKTTGADIRQGIVNLPLLYALQQDDGSLEKQLSRRPKNGRRLKQIITHTKELNGIERARAVAQSYTHKALYSIKQLPEGEARRALEQFTAFLLQRNY